MNISPCLQDVSVAISRPDAILKHHGKRSAELYSTAVLSQQNLCHCGIIHKCTIYLGNGEENKHVHTEQEYPFLR